VSRLLHLLIFFYYYHYYFGSEGVCLCDLISFEMFTGSVARTGERTCRRYYGTHAGGRAIREIKTDFQLDRSGSVSISSRIKNLSSIVDSIYSSHSTPKSYGAFLFFKFFKRYDFRQCRFNFCSSGFPAIHLFH
jgi:hypothetical protein